jgi:hypothetical protein
MSHNKSSGPPDMRGIPTLPFIRIRFYPRLLTIKEEEEIETTHNGQDVVARKVRKEWYQRLKKPKKVKK